MVRVLLDHGATVHSEDNLGRTPLHLVAKGTTRDIGHDGVAVAELLLEHGADSNAKDKHQTTPLHLASYCGNIDIVRVLLDHEANSSAKNAQGYTALHMVSRGAFSSQEGGEAVTWLLLKHGADVDARSTNDETPLDFASRSNEKIASLLLHYHGFKNEKIDQGLLSYWFMESMHLRD